MKTLLMTIGIALMCVTGTVYAKHNRPYGSSQCVWVNGAYNCYSGNPYYYRGNHGWSDGEKVIAGMLVINAIAQASRPEPDPVSEAYKAGVRARQLEQQQRAAERAYMCGYTGTCGD
jgi:hypothetical protein